MQESKETGLLTSATSAESAIVMASFHSNSDNLAVHVGCIIWFDVSGTAAAVRNIWGTRP
jgi:hypothetical protein